MCVGAVPAVIDDLFVAMAITCGEIEPRSYVNTPVGINFLLAGFAHSDGGLSISGSDVLVADYRAQLTLNTGPPGG